ncbi:MAG: ADP-forming succinate--CoA ligase subunit beta [Pseudomonadota bacterium]|nr:ADP-forming succinate--CoA ligase subunit beta [Pseudomonadota bacterium]MEC8107924.1 ADP-forming succinate--CoA ligase subunit beta [Pseudomonadota bacterium]MEC8378326.1 ADP-forming succinate--CoA ligase subunit beta [Pseudomonadota bacterium]
MNLHEYQAKSLFRDYGLPVSKSEIIFSESDIDGAVSNLNVNKFVVKAQVHAGGRGKAGGVILTESIKEVREFCQKWLGKNMVTYQTDSKGQPVSCILLEECTDIERELYLGLVIDRSSKSIAVIASPDGGVDIESVAENNPEKIFKVFLNSSNEIQEEEIKKISDGLELNQSQYIEFSELIKNLVKLFTEKDFALIEINPLVVNTEGRLNCLDGKINVDGNALYRQEALSKMRDISQEDKLELEASKWGLNYVTLDGSVGCMVNGAGLAMGTMDIIKLYGGFPANFLDVGGAVNRESVTEAFKIIVSDSKVKSILINIFGGIVRCDVVAEGIVSAIQDVGIEIPVVVRLKGNNAEVAKDILEESRLNIFSELDLSLAAKKVVELSK